MKQNIKNFFKVLVTDRYLLVLSAAILVLAIIYSINLGLSINPSDIKIVSHYSAFGIANYYTDSWFYLLNFIMFGIIVAFLHIITAVKLLAVKGHTIAVVFLWSGVGVIFMGWVTFQQVLNVLK